MIKPHYFCISLWTDSKLYFPYIWAWCKPLTSPLGWFNTDSNKIQLNLLILDINVSSSCKHIKLKEKIVFHLSVQGFPERYKSKLIWVYVHHLSHSQRSLTVCIHPYIHPHSRRSRPLCSRAPSYRHVNTLKNAASRYTTVSNSRINMYFTKAMMNTNRRERILSFRCSKFWQLLLF